MEHATWYSVHPLSCKNKVYVLLAKLPRTSISSNVLSQAYSGRPRACGPRATLVTYTHAALRNNNLSHHPPAILKELPAAISRRLTDISHDEEVFMKTSSSWSTPLRHSITTPWRRAGTRRRRPTWKVGNRTAGRENLEKDGSHGSIPRLARTSPPMLPTGSWSYSTPIFPKAPSCTPSSTGTRSRLVTRACRTLTPSSRGTMHTCAPRNRRPTSKRGHATAGGPANAHWAVNASRAASCTKRPSRPQDHRARCSTSARRTRRSRPVTGTTRPASPTRAKQTKRSCQSTFGSLRQDPPWFEFLVIFDFFAPWYRKRRGASSVKIS